MTPREGGCVDKLIAKTPCAGQVPLSVGAMTVSEVDLGAMTSLSPRKGQGAALAQALRAAHGLDWPGAGRVTTAGDARAIWFGHDSVLLTGAAPDAALAGPGVLVDQSDAWTVVRLEGTGAEAVLARLVPVDLRAPGFGPGATARCRIGHMAGSVTRLEDGGFLLMVFRSMAQTLLHDLKSAMEAVAARG
ncbi:sarcosine oxidase, gamma subunit family [Ruegeria pomeroyi DSS-3]|uniref:Sarcosine oxidase, gamma subunit family n=1 Tax=Ruegeria pomeroyi (strain ATCC 700808 / DSM 15171 / DSS-3) TaxID=246200 RepID=Q5LSM0_RUEPO|nr:sarcosine oxidase, gamma subunit family [Ruegeria pomeroyi DSS-3]